MTRGELMEIAMENFFFSLEDCWSFRAVDVPMDQLRHQISSVVAVVLCEAEKICRDKQREGKDAQSCADAIKKLNGDA
jgi:hypothetical protein